MEPSLESRIGQLESRALIAELCTRYNMACDNRDLALLEDCLTEDVVFRSYGGQIDAQGRALVMKTYTDLFATRGPGFHWTHDRITIFDETDPNAANGIVFAHAESTPNGTPTISAFRYDDIYRYDNGRWKFSSRIISFLYYLPVSDYISRISNVNRVNIDGNWSPPD